MRPLTVGWIGNFSKPWCSEVHFTASVESLGHRVVRWQENTLDWATLPRLAEGEATQVVFWTRTWDTPRDVVTEAFGELRSAGIPSVAYHLDRWWGLEREYQIHTEPFFRLNLVVSPDDQAEKWAAAGVNHLWMPPGVYAAECGEVAPNPRRWPHDVVFVGSFPYPHPAWAPYRAGLVAAFRGAFGKRFGVWPQRGRPIRGRDLQELYATAKVVVGDSCLSGSPKMYWSDRIPESLGRGALLIHPRVDGMEAWYRTQRWEHGSGDLHPYAEGGSWPPDSFGDLLTYDLGDFGQAVRLAEWALARPVAAQQIRAQGRATVLGRDTYAHRLAAVLTHVEETLGIPPARPPHPVAPKAAGTILARSAKHRLRASFLLAEGDTDRTAVEEVWRDDTYRVERADIAGKVVVDVGANIGAFAVLAAKLGAKVVHAYEPHPANRSCLERNVVANGVADRVAVHGEAVTGKTGATVCLDGTGGGVHLADEGIEVSTISLADILTTAGQVALLKFDAEGAEWLAFESICAHLLHDHVKRIALEWHGPLIGPHCAHLNDDGGYIGRWHRLVEILADCGRLEVMGHPTVGGLMYWRAH